MGSQGRRRCGALVSLGAGGRLARHDPPLALANTGVLDRQSLAGALGTGTHGTGIHYPIMSAQVRVGSVAKDTDRGLGI